MLTTTDLDLTVLEELDFEPPCCIVSAVTTTFNGQTSTQVSTEPCGRPAVAAIRCLSCRHIGLICDLHRRAMISSWSAFCFKCNVVGKFYDIYEFVS